MSIFVASSCGKKYVLVMKELNGEDYTDIQAPSFLGATKHACAVDTRPSFSLPLFPLCARGPGDEATPNQEIGFPGISHRLSQYGYV